MAWLDGDWITVALIILAVVLFNVGLLYSLLSGSARTQWDMLRRLAQRSRNPWQREDDALRELRSRSARLNPSPPEDPDGA